MLANDRILPIIEYDQQALAQTLVLDEARPMALEKAVALDPSQKPRFPLLAYGANASVEGLRRKFRELEGQDRILPVLDGEISGLDVSYSPHFSSYGAMPATLSEAPGVKPRVSLLLVTQGQFDALAATEVNYRFGWFRQTQFRSPSANLECDLYAFVSRHGAFSIEGKTPSLRAVSAIGRQQPTLTEREVLNLAAAALGLSDGEKLVFRAIEDYLWAVENKPALSATAQAFDHPDWVNAFELS